MIQENTTKNQHFIAQFEQRLNANNPNACHKNKRIYCFNIVDRNELSVKLSNPKGVKVENNLAIDDLYSFDILNDKYRKNFEEIFKVYEKNADSAITNIVSEFKDKSNKYQKSLRCIYGYKILNSLRNPYLIKKTLETYSLTEDLYPRNPELMKNCLNILSKIKPQSPYLCKLLNISDDDYRKWLKLIYLLLSYDPHDGSSKFDGYIHRHFDAPDYVCIAILYHFTDNSSDKVVLLQDNAIIEIENKRKNLQSTFFNVSSKMFLSVSFNHISNVISEIGLSKETPIKELHHFLYKENDFEWLSIFNRRCIKNAKNSVYCASNVAYGIKII